MESIGKHIGQKIKHFRKINKLTQDELGEKINTKKATISNYETGYRTPSQDTLFELADIFNISINELFPPTKKKDIANVYNQLEEPRKAKVYEFAEYQLEEQRKAIDVHDYVEDEMSGYLSAGTGEYLSEDVKETVRIPKSIIPDQHYDMILKVNGDSMEPMFEDGEYVFVREIKNPEDIRSGQVGVFIIDGESYLKKAYVNDDFLRLVSLNTNYKDLIFDNVNDIKPIGTVVL